MHWHPIFFCADDGVGTADSDVSACACTVGRAATHPTGATLHALRLAVDAVVGEVGGHFVGFGRVVLIDVQLRLLLVVCYNARTCPLVRVVVTLGRRAGIDDIFIDDGAIFRSMRAGTTSPTRIIVIQSALRQD